MAANQFLPFATSAGALVLTPANYAVLANRPLGFQPGIAQANECNSVWRQSSFIAAVVAQFVTNQTGLDVLDDGDLNGKVALLLAAIQAAAAALPDNDAAIALSTAIAVRDAQVNLFTI